MAQIVVTVLIGLLLIILGTMIWQHQRYDDARHSRLHDTQSLFHGSDTLHVVTFLELAPGDDLFQVAGNLRQAAEGATGKLVYAGKVALNALMSTQLEATFGRAVDWDAVILSQWPSEAAWHAFHDGEAGRSAFARFRSHYHHGMQRSAFENLLLPQVLLARRVKQLVSRAPSHFPFQPANAAALQTDDQRLGRLLDHREQGRDAILVVNLLQTGTAEQAKADAAYGDHMLDLMAEGGHGPMHVGRAVTLEHDTLFDRIALVYYPGVQYFHDMARSRFYQGIVGGKQPVDTQASITVPILHRL